MSDLPLKEIKIEQARVLDNSKYDIMLKRDGTLIYYIDGDLISSRGINRNARFPHIKKILDDANFPNCMGELFIDGGNVFDISSSINWAKARYMPFELMDKNTPYNVGRDILKNKIALLNNNFIVPVTIFSTIEEGWDFVKKANGEGLVLKNASGEWYKVKILREFKIPIKRWEPGKDKGTFILDDISGSRVSGTSMTFVQQYLGIQSQGKTAIAEVETPFVTNSGKLFQPRLRQITIQEQESLKMEVVQ